MVSHSVSIGLIKDIFAQPLTYAIERNAVAADTWGSKPFTIRYSSLAENAQLLAAGEVGIALISPIDYAKNSTEWEVFPGLGIASYGVTGAAKLLFREELVNISTIATDLRFPTEMVVSQIVFLEKTGDKPRFITHGVQPGIIPADSDAVLLIGDAALPVKTIQESVFDISEEWNDISDAPLVHAVFAGRRDAISPTSAAILLQSYAYYAENKDTIIRDLSTSRGIDYDRLYTHLNEELRYTLDDLDIDGIKEIFRHCFFHKMLDEIPDLAFFRPASENHVRLN
jgi:predicted solute-binding protein